MNKGLKKISYCRYHYNNNDKDILYSKRRLFTCSISYRLINTSCFGIELTIIRNNTVL